MAKRGLQECKKLPRLARELKVPLWAAAGLLEMFWHWSAKNALTGFMSLEDLESAAFTIRFEEGEMELGRILCATGWLDEVEGGFWIHDWDEHADESVRKTLRNRGLSFWNGSPAFGKPKADGANPSPPVPEEEPKEPRKVIESIATVSRNGSEGFAHLSEPKPEPVPEPNSAPDGAGGKPADPPPSPNEARNLLADPLPDEPPGEAGTPFERAAWVLRTMKERLRKIDPVKFPLSPVVAADVRAHLKPESNLQTLIGFYGEAETVAMFVWAYVNWPSGQKPTWKSVCVQRDQIREAMKGDGEGGPPAAASSQRTPKPRPPGLTETFDNNPFGGGANA